MKQILRRALLKTFWAWSIVVLALMWYDQNTSVQYVNVR
jgi:hypothetical protein